MSKNCSLLMKIDIANIDMICKRIILGYITTYIIYVDEKFDNKVNCTKLFSK